jgi:ABC-type dipeptide/oligopeptide/nickel transport system ATPase component
MARVIGIMGESGSGKTTSMRSLDPSTTFYIDCDKKGLSWKGWKDSYVSTKNYWASDNPSDVMNILQKINTEDKFKNVKTVIIDTINGVMVAEEMRNAKVQGFGKWTDLAQYVWNIFDYCLTMRENVTIIIVAHSITDTDDAGLLFTHIRTNGRKLEKIVLESKLNTVLLAECKDGRYIFHTKSDRSSVKTPLGAFEEDEIDNDITKVIKALEDF